MKTELVNISELDPGDKLYIPWSGENEKPDWHKLNDVVTVRAIDNGNTVLIEESGGLSLKAKEFKRIIDLEEPEAGDTITFKMEWFNEFKLKENREFTCKVERLSKDPMKIHKPKCIVSINDEDYGITFDMISNIEKTSRTQLELF